MMHSLSDALKQESPLQVVGVINAMAALLAKKAGFKALYLSGAGVANAMGLPDLGMTTFTEVRDEISKITEAVSLPLLVDGDTGFGSQLTIRRMIPEFYRAGAAAIHLEDQVFPKRCGHRPGKTVVSSGEMCDRIKEAVDARPSEDFLIMARTDAIHAESLESAVERAKTYEKAGADMIFVEAAMKLENYRVFTEALSVPILANMTEFGQTPLINLDELAAVKVAMVLYPLSAFRAMNKAAELVYRTIRETGSQASVLSSMQTRDELYELLNYYYYEDKL